MRCIYEVTVTVEQEIAPEYENWLRSHLKEVVTAAGFRHGEIYAVESDSTERKTWVCHYHALNREQIDSYLQLHAPRLRADGISRFGKRFTAERKILIFQF